jgi:hypothetical protein
MVADKTGGVDEKIEFGRFGPNKRACIYSAGGRISMTFERSCPVSYLYEIKSRLVPSIHKRQEPVDDATSRE